jgi:pimeloyl-ACP methyl ester carboxylesterase
MVSEVNGSKLFYVREGQGPENLLFFHGFGQDHAVFLSLAKALSSRYTCYIFDLYFHGESTWQQNEQPLQKEDWKKIMAHFLEENHLEKFSLAGFSLGSKLALATLEAFPEKTTALFLLAPDGIKTNFWYRLATYPYLFRQLFKSMIVHPQRFLSLVKAFQAFGLLDKSLLRFAGSQMNTEEKRKRVYLSWVVFRPLKFDLEELASTINHYHIHTTIVTGKFDKVIRSKNMNRLIRHLQHPQVIVAETGHNRLLTHAIVFEVMNKDKGTRYE